MDNCRAIGELVSSSSRETAFSVRKSTVLYCRFIQAQTVVILETELTLDYFPAMALSYGNKII